MHLAHGIGRTLLVLLFLIGCGVADQPSGEPVVSAATTVPTPTATHLLATPTATMSLRPTSHPRIPQTLIPVTPTPMTPTRSVFIVPPEDVEPDNIPTPPTANPAMFPIFVPVNVTYEPSVGGVILQWPYINLAGYDRTTLAYGIVRFNTPIPPHTTFQEVPSTILAIIPVVEHQTHYEFLDSTVQSGTSYQYLVYSIISEHETALPEFFYDLFQNGLSNSITIP